MVMKMGKHRGFHLHIKKMICAGVTVELIDWEGLTSLAALTVLYNKKVAYAWFIYTHNSTYLSILRSLQFSLLCF